MGGYVNMYVCVYICVYICIYLYIYMYFYLRIYNWLYTWICIKLLLGVTFVTGLAIISKLQAFDDTDSAYATQISLEGEGEWDAGSDSWMP
jgi:hypothetical protein